MTVHRGKPLTAVGRTAWLAAGTAVLCLLGGAVTLTGAAAAQVTAGVLIALTGAAALLALRGRLTAERACLLLLAAGILLRITYALYTGYGERQHDVWLVTSGKGHMAYIQYIAEHLSLPDTNRTWQFYHPPLHHILAGLLYRLLTACGAAAETAAEKLQLLTAFYSGAVLIVSDRIAVRCGLQGAGRVTALAFLAFHPTGLLLAGSLNNDTLLWLLSLLTLLWLLRWQEAPTVSNSVWMAVWLGLSMMAKTSGVLLAPAIAFAFCRLLWRARRCPLSVRPQFRRMLLFGAVSIPLGMWYPVRNLLRFGQPLFYVPRISDVGQYVGDVSFSDRLWRIPWEQLSSPYQSLTEGYNIPLSAWKTSLFGEGNFGPGVWPYLLLGSAALLLLPALYGAVLSLVRRPLRDTAQLLACVAGFITVSYTVFCFTYPHICSQDFRYLVMTLPVVAVWLGYAAEVPPQKDTHRALYRVRQGVTAAGMALFCLSSAAVYLSVGMSAAL